MFIIHVTYLPYVFHNKWIAPKFYVTCISYMSHKKNIYRMYVTFYYCHVGVYIIVYCHSKISLNWKATCLSFIKDMQNCKSLLFPSSPSPLSLISFLCSVSRRTYTPIYIFCDLSIFWMALADGYLSKHFLPSSPARVPSQLLPIETLKFYAQKASIKKLRQTRFSFNRRIAPGSLLFKNTCGNL